METYHAANISTDMSFLEMLDVVNEQLTLDGREPIAFDSDCREGICGTCGAVVNGRPHGPEKGTTLCQLHMRHFSDGDTMVIEPLRARAFKVIKDLVVDRSALDRIIQAGGYISVNTGGAQDANAIPVPKENADLAMDAAACIGCGACVAACPNASAMLFVGAKVSHLALLPQGRPEAAQACPGHGAQDGRTGLRQLLQRTGVRGRVPQGDLHHQHRPTQPGIHQGRSLLGPNIASGSPTRGPTGRRASPELFEPDRSSEDCPGQILDRTGDVRNEDTQTSVFSQVPRPERGFDRRTSTVRSAALSAGSTRWTRRPIFLWIVSLKNGKVGAAQHQGVHLPDLERMEVFFDDHRPSQASVSSLPRPGGPAAGRPGCRPWPTGTAPGWRFHGPRRNGGRARPDDPDHRPPGDLHRGVGRRGDRFDHGDAEPLGQSAKGQTAGGGAGHDDQRGPLVHKEADMLFGRSRRRFRVLAPIRGAGRVAEIDKVVPGSRSISARATANPPIPESKMPMVTTAHPSLGGPERAA